MLYREIIAVCSEIHIKLINILCGQNVDFLNVKLAVHTVTTGLSRAKKRRICKQLLHHHCTVQLTINSFRPTIDFPSQFCPGT